MYPTYRDGDRVLVRRRPAHLLNRRDVVVIEQPPDLGSGWDDLPPFDGRLVGRRWNIKRLVALPGDRVPDSVRVAAGTDVVSPGSLVVLGDNIRSRDSRRVGFYPADRVLGVVVRQLHASAGAEADSGPPAFRQNLLPPWVEHRLERNGYEICKTDRDNDR